MKAHLLLLALFALITSISHSQTVVWSEDFNSGSGAQGSPAATYTSGNGNWSQTDVGSTGGFPNTWYVSDQESGAGVGNCGAASLGDPTLHVGNVAGSPGGLCPSGDCGAAYDASGGTETSERVESPIINLTGQTGLTLEFEHIGFGEIGLDYVDAVYSDDGGLTWNIIPGGANITSECCCLIPGFCGGPDPIPCTDPLSGQGYWQLVTLALPVSCENNPNVKVGFHWQNDGNNAGTDPSCAIDDVVITSSAVSAPLADFSANLTNICEGDCIDFTDLSTLSTNPTWTWTFTGAATASSSVQNPTGICYPTAGTYQVELAVTDDNGADNEIKVGYITVVAAPNAGSNAAQNLCNNTTLDLNTLIPGADPGTWVETSGTPSGQFTPGTGILDGNGLAVGNVYTFDYTVTGTAPCADATTTMTITIIDCTGGAPPIADFSANLTNICEGDCIDFTDMSTLSANPTWTWTFTGAATASSSVQNPTGICYPTAGTYQVELAVTDDNGADNEIKVGYITVVAAPNAGSNSAQNLCNNTTLDLNTLIQGADPGTWVETSGTPSGQFTPGTGVLDGNGLPVGNVYTFDYTVTGTAPCADATSTMTITMVDCSSGPTTDFTASQTTICEGDCIDFTDQSAFGTNPTWSWTFAGATTPTSSAQDPTNICYATAGTYQVELTVTDDNGTDTHTEVNYITVNPTPIVTATASPSDTICDGDQVTLTGGGASTYVWDNGVTDGTAFTPTATTVYTVTGTDVNGCMRDAIIEVVVEICDTVSADWSVMSTNICNGDCITFTDLSTGNIDTWMWTFDGGATPDTIFNNPNPTVCFDSTGTFNVTLEVSGSGLTSSFSQVISVFDPPTVTAMLDTLIDLGGSADLIAVGSGPGSYIWTPDYNISCDTCAITSANPYLNTDYVVTFSDINGCLATDTVYVMVNFIEGIDVPTAFSPNGDGNNDILFVKGIGIDIMTFSVYNRYGQKVFETDYQDIGWDGTFKGRDENSGVFTWMLEYKLVNGATGILKGNTTLVR